MKLSEASELQLRYQGKPGFTATIVRILPKHIDPPKHEDNGWDLLIEYNENHSSGFAGSLD